MPLALLPAVQGNMHSLSNTSISGGVVQTSPQSLLQPTAAGVVTAPSGNNAGTEARPTEAETGAPQAAIDMDELVEKTWLKIMRKLTIERERRGHPKWV